MSGHLHSPRGRGIPLLALIAAIAAAFALCAPWSARPTSAAEPGESLFQSKCAACHTIGGGSLAGPDLKGVTSRRDHAWLLSVITAPDRLIASGDPTMKELQATYSFAMPNLGISKADAEAILSFVDGRSSTGVAQPAGATAVQPAAAGDPVLGQAYFSGAITFAGGGPACSSCHAIDAPGSAAGGSLGPNLTLAHTRLGGDAGLAGALAGLPFPTMMPVYAGRLLSPQEQADLLAYLSASAAVAGPSPDALEVYGVPAAIGAVSLFALAGLLGRRRLRGVHRPLVQRATRGR